MRSLPGDLLHYGVPGGNRARDRSLHVGERLPPRLPRLYPGIGALHFPLGSNFVVNDISGHVLLESFAVPCVERINELASNSNEIGHTIPPLGLGQDVWAPGRDEYTPGSLPR